MRFLSQPFVKYSFFVLLWGFYACHSETHQTRIGFYHWKTKLDLAAWPLVSPLNPTRLYVKCFDVDWPPQDTAPHPMALIEGLEMAALADSVLLVPTVFITHRTLLRASNEQIEVLAARVFGLLNRQVGQRRIAEYQIDCDWTAQTKEKFFLFLRLFKQKIGVNALLSATIRLHQVKDKATMGLPPVDKGLLMAYNMGNLDDITVKNSIIDPNIVASYASYLRDYPLYLDIALPIFSWAVVFRDGQAVQLLNQVAASDCALPAFRPLSAHQFEVQTAHYFKGTRLFPDDILRIEQAPLSSLESAALILKKHLRQPPQTLAFYHLDTLCLKNYPPDFLTRLADVF